MKRIQILTWLTLALFLIVMGPITYILSARADSFAGSPLNTKWLQKRAVEPVTIMFTGDIMLGRYIQTLMERNGGDFPFTHMPEITEKMESELEVEDLNLVVGNLEGPITTYGKHSNTSMVFNFKPSVVPLLQKVGFTTFSLANNHTFNQGKLGYSHTYHYLDEAGLRAFGHPDTHAGQNSFLRYDFQDVSIGFLGLNDVDFKLERDEVNARIAELDSQVDFLIIGVHWGIEYLPEAPAYIEDMAHQFVDKGADFIWGHHPHVIQNSEIYNGAPIYYSLGNFVFDQYWSTKTQEGLVVGLKITENGIITKEFTVDLVNMGEPKPRPPESSP